MLTYYLKYKRGTKNIDSKMLKTKNGILMLSSRFMKEQESKGLS